MPRLYHTASKHSSGPLSGWPFYLLPSFPRWAASTHNLLPFHVWSAGEEDKGLVQVKINEVVYMAYRHQESAVPFFSFLYSKVASNLLKKKKEEEEGNYTCAVLAAQ